jgi:hypothetical protein
MDVLGNVTKWAMANAHPLLDNSTMVGGDPAKREPYGYVHSSQAKSIVTLRNPFVRPQTMKLKIDEANGFSKFKGVQQAQIIYPRPRVLQQVAFGDTMVFDLNAYEELVAEFGSTDVIMVQGAAADWPASRNLTFSPKPIVYPRGGGVKLGADVDVPPGYSQARLAILLEPQQEVRGVKADATDGSKALTLSTENGGRGVWYWYWADLSQGTHSVAVTISEPGPAHVSVWLLTRHGPGGPGGMLPAESERGTQLVLEETIR